MPSTIPTPTQSEWAKPENDSVFDPLYETLLKKAARVSGLDTPQGQLMSAINPVPLISKIPFSSVGPRNAELLRALRGNQSSPELINAVEFAAKKYPRILAHVEGLEEAHIPSPKGKMNLGIQAQRPDSPLSDIMMNTEAIKKRASVMNMPVDQHVADTFGHELTHAAQNIWHGDSFKPLYDAANNWERKPSYDINMFENGANKAGANFAQKMGVVPPPAPAKPGMAQRLLDLFNTEK